MADSGSHKVDKCPSATKFEQLLNDAYDAKTRAAQAVTLPNAELTKLWSDQAQAIQQRIRSLSKLFENLVEGSKES